MPYTLKRLLVGKAKRTAQMAHERLTKKTGLAVFASDALSSTAYATEEILLVLAVAYAAQANSFNYVVPITFGIVIVLTIVAMALVSRNARAPAALLVPFRKEER